MSKLRLALISILVLALVGIIIYHNQTKARVLVIHSYNTDFPWVSQVNGGIKQYLASNPGDVVVRYHYMDLRNHPTCDFYRSAANDVRLVIQDWQPQVIIIVDDIGQALVGMNYLQFKPGVDGSSWYDRAAAIAAKGGCAGDPKKDKNFFGQGNLSDVTPLTVIFAGINGDVEQYGYYEAENVTGIFEHKNPEAIRQTIADIYRAIPEDRRPTSIQVLSDKSATANSEKDFGIREFELSVPLEWKEIGYAGTFDEWQQLVATANENGSMLLIANYGQIKEKTGDDKPMGAAKLISWTEQNARYPVLGAATNFIIDGGMLTLAVPGYEQGQVAISMALEVLKGTPVSNIEPVAAKQFMVGMNKSLVVQRGLSLPLIYEAYSRESNNILEK